MEAGQGEAPGLQPDRRPCALARLAELADERAVNAIKVFREEREAQL